MFTVDFFTPVVDDPVHFGKIAAANSISDVYAMGGSPFLGLNILGFPINDVPVKTLNKILAGASEKCIEAGIVVGGGHSIKDSELKFGMAINGFVNNNEFIDNSHAKPGDYIILTKPIGTGIITTAQKLTNKVNKRIMQSAIQSMEKINRCVRDIMIKFKIKSATDITGFGLLGHIYEIASASCVDIDVSSEKVPLFDGVLKLAENGYIPGGTIKNYEYLKKHVRYDKSIGQEMKYILCDAQTSGGIVIFCDEHKAEKIITQLKKTEICHDIIGRVTGTGNGGIHIK